jgi:hypothetical protein
MKAETQSAGSNREALRHPRRCRFWPLVKSGMLLYVFLLTAGCDPKVSVTGLVTNIDGEPLPGVSVKVEDTQAFGVSNGNGIFGKRPNPISVPTGRWELTYIKSGFTSAKQMVDAPERGNFEAPPVALWPLPAAKGVYVLETINYLPFTRVTPERYRGLDGAPVFGVKQVPELMLDAAPPYFISHKMANYDWALTRLEQKPVLRPGVEVNASTTEVDPALTETVWTASVRLPIDALPVDLPEQLLWQIRPAGAMPPGYYALHWGAFEGDATTEESVYLVGIRDPAAPVEVPEDGAPDGDTPVSPEAAEVSAPPEEEN